MITLHYLENSQAIRILWLLEELDIDYDLKMYAREADLTAPLELKNISPLETSPVITDDKGLVLAESNAIIEYLLDMADTNDSKRLRPPLGSPQRVSFLFWFHTGPTSFQHAMQTDTLMTLIPTRVPWFIRAIVDKVASKTKENYVLPRVRAILQHAENHLQNFDFLAGSNHDDDDDDDVGTPSSTFTVADIVNLYSVESAMTRYPALQTEFPNVEKWRQNMQAQPSLLRALKKAGQSDKNVIVATMP